MVELPTTEAELDALISSKVKEATDSLISKHNGEMASLRTKHTAELERVKKEATMSAEELALQKAKEQNDADQQELADLRSYKKSRELEDRLSKEGLPAHFKYDTRLLNASESDLEKVLKDVKKEYEATQPQGNPHSSIVQTNTATAQPGDEKSIAYAKMGEALKEAIGR